MTRGLGQARGSARRGEHGSVLAALVATLAVASILMTVAATEWGFIVRREKEKDLIFRGTAIARAIQEFQQKQGRAPVSLEEMTKTRPPVLRRVLPDPMTARYDREGKLIAGTGEWTYISVTAAQPGARPDAGGSRRDDSTAGPVPGGGRGPSMQPFLGVRSRSEEESIGTYQDSEPGVPYSEWRFQVLTADPSNLMQHVGGVEAIYPPGFAGLRVPGGPPYVGGAAAPAPNRPMPGGAPRPQAPRAPGP